MYRRRLKVFLVLIAATIVLVVARLVHLQVFLGAESRLQAERLAQRDRYLPTVRAKVLDRRGRVLAFDEACFDFCIDYRVLAARRTSTRPAYRSLTPAERWVRRQVLRIARRQGVSKQDAELIYRRRTRRAWEIAREITGAAPSEMARAAAAAEDRVRAVRRAMRRRGTGGEPIEAEEHHPIVAGLDEAAALALRARLDETLGASVRPSHRRRYPYGAAACHVIGRTAPVSEKMLARLARQVEPFDGADSPRLARLSAYLPGDRTGVSGVERLCERLLRGRRGYRRWRATDNRITREVPVRLGGDVHLTLDVELQQAIAREIASVPGRKGSAVVLDVPTGEVLAMVSVPTYDLNTYRADFARLAADRVNLPLLHRAVGVRYPPGSTCKPLAATAGLACGAIAPGTSIECRGYLHNPDQFRCWIWKKYAGRTHGVLDVVMGLKHSCNIFFYTVGERVGLKRMNEWFGRFGFADPPGTLLPGEVAGRLPKAGGTGAVARARLLAIGQGPVAVTPMHVAGAIAAVARGGEYRSAVLVRELADRQLRRKLPVSPEHIDLVRRGMYLVVNSRGGTAYKYAHDAEIVICGKTGTAETPPHRVDGEVVRSGDAAWFAGFAPYRRPKVAFAIVIEYSATGGAETCGPIARKIVHLCRKYGYLD